MVERARCHSLAVDDRFVLRSISVGLPGWTLPNVAIIDGFGLNDYIVARAPPRTDLRVMAHSRRPPPGYVECFSPNARLIEGKPRGTVEVRPRAQPLTDAGIRACEQPSRWLGNQQ
jgi:arabinofuranosyltransferase